MPTTHPLPLRHLPLDDWDEVAQYQHAYDLPDYPGARTGNGHYVDLYAGPEDKEIEAQGYDRITIGRLWTTGGTTGLLHLENEDQTLYTVVALRLRLMYQDGVTAQDAFDDIVTDFDAGPVFAGELDDIADPDIELNDDI